MLTYLRKPVLVMGFMALSPLAALLPGVASDAQAHTYSRGHVRISLPLPPLPRISLHLPRVGLSFGDPYIGRRAYYAPGYDAYGPDYYGYYAPTYYYPQPQYYGPYYPRYGYSPYGRPSHYRGYYDRYDRNDHRGYDRYDRDDHRGDHRGGNMNFHRPSGRRTRGR